jgi:hypothetical protein
MPFAFLRQERDKADAATAIAEPSSIKEASYGPIANRAKLCLES